MAGPLVEEAKLLGEALNTVKINVLQMKRYLESDQLMDALKCASTMLAELRTSSLTPKQYYELYMSVFDALRHVSNYLYEAHTSGRHHLADLYELVQYAGNIVPRLYLMITVGAVYMSIPDAPVKEIMKDMMEMSRGVQHPTRGLFLRHYLSGQTRDHLPVGDDQGEGGNLQDSISFVLTNFIEMNKLWVRLQHQGHSRDREKREMERRELRILVGTNLVRLSSLEGVDLDMYQRTILPSILEQVVNCKDTIAQEYLMEVVIQVFTDEFHLHTLGPFLSATAQLQPKVNIKQIVIALIDRLAAYAAREAESEDPEVTKAQEEAAAKRLAEKVKQQKAVRAQQGGWAHQNGSAEEFSSDPEDVDAILELCQVLIREQRDAATGLGSVTHGYAKDPTGRRQQQSSMHLENEDLAEEQGWLAKMVHLFRSDSFDVQFDLIKAARKHFETGGDRMRFTFPALISSCFKLARRVKRNEDKVEEWQSKVAAILKFARQMLFTLSTQVEAHTPALRLFLLAAQISDECGFEDLTYDFYVQAFSVYEESISDSRAQLQAITLIIGTLQGAKVFGMDNYDTLIQKAAVHASRLLKKPHQATAVHLASHMWWQQAGPDEVVPEPDTTKEASEAKAYPHKDSKRVLECLQKSLRIASSAIEEIVTVQLYVDALDQYLYYMDRDAPAVTPKFVNSLVELITSSIDGIASTDFHPASRAPPGLIEGVQTPDMISRHFRNTLYYIQAKKAALAGPGKAERPNPKWEEIDVVGACLKMNIGVNGAA
ncbi:vacuolar protein sorting-associated protein 35 [Exidia glandulosa HHB12029]|uniref:Vacuolar protein sorting-associated protein 35 n=1 Tax=Exidia glandulosa HHB12029 TaxID=1314781 RepID=A0A165NGU7_EXIGL|nr:vacuolar protein sorting-associated protein 35 [Exidia glandulosa HHB12029]